VISWFQIEDGIRSSQHRFTIQSFCLILTALWQGMRGSRLGREAIFIGRELRWLGICALILSGTILCVGVGVAVGVSTNSVDLGISVMSGLATLFTCVEAFAFWVYK
jgi:hypothetical protein